MPQEPRRGKRGLPSGRNWPSEGLRGYGLGVKVSGLGFRVSGLGIRSRALGLGFRASGLEFRLAEVAAVVVAALMVAGVLRAVATCLSPLPAYRPDPTRPTCFVHVIYHHPIARQAWFCGLRLLRKGSRVLPIVRRLRF